MIAYHESQTAGMESNIHPFQKIKGLTFVISYQFGIREMHLIGV